MGVWVGIGVCRRVSMDDTHLLRSKTAELARFPCSNSDLCANTLGSVLRSREVVCEMRVLHEAGVDGSIFGFNLILAFVPEDAM